jgi:hypothetical protein
MFKKVLSWFAAMFFMCMVWGQTTTLINQNSSLAGGYGSTTLVDTNSNSNSNSTVNTNNVNSGTIIKLQLAVQVSIPIITTTLILAQ